MRCCGTPSGLLQGIVRTRRVIKFDGELKAASDDFKDHKEVGSLAVNFPRRIILRQLTLVSSN